MKCTSCGREIEKLPEGSFRCPYCSGRILSKPRKNFVKRVKAI
ncbi:MAG: DNA-directed RNA polymerase subunit P [Candidatus Hadarchaeales archaeon]